MGAITGETAGNMPEVTTGQSLAVVIPAFNEAARITATISEVHRHVRQRFDTVEIIVVDDGSRDRTAAVVERLQGSLPALKLLRLPANRGKGAAVREGVHASTADLVLLSDADLSAPIEELETLLPWIAGGVDVVIGSRAMKDSRIGVRQPLHRRTVGKVFGLLARLVVGLPHRDTQCGFKLFTRAAAALIFEQARIDRFSFDVEALFIARKAGLRVEERPIRWSDSPETRVRVFRDSIRMVLDLGRIRWYGTAGAYSTSRIPPDPLGS